MRPFLHLSLVILTITLSLTATGGIGTTAAQAEIWGKLYVETDPPEAQVRFLGIKYEYMPGIILRDGTYSVEVSSPGRQNVTRKVRVVGGQSTTVQIALPPQKGSAAEQTSALSQAEVLEESPQENASETWGKLFIDTDPPGANIRFININYKYKPGIILRKGTYLVEVSLPGIGSVQKELPLLPGIDNRFLIHLNDPVDKAEALQIPTTGLSDEPGRLIVITDPPGVPVRFLNSDLRYTPGMPLQPGHYLLEVSDTAGRSVVKEVDITSGRETRILASLGTREQSGSASRNLPPALKKFAIPDSRIRDTSAMEAAAPPPPAPEPQDGQLVVYTEPADATVSLQDSNQPYQPGMLLPAGTYTLEIRREGYDTVRKNVNVAGSQIQQLHVRLQEQNKTSNLPASLKQYAIRAPKKTRKRPAAAPQKRAEGGLMLHIDPPDSTVFFLNTNTPYTPGVRLPAGGYQVKIDKPGYESVTIQVEIKAGKELEAQIRLRPKAAASTALPLAPAPNAAPAYPQVNADLSTPVPLGANAPANAALTPEQQLVLEANDLLNTGNYKEAFQRFGQALKMDPKMAAAFKGRGFIYYQLGKYKHAIKEYDKCLSLAPDDSEGFYERGNAYLAAGSKKRALKDYNKAIALNPGFPDAYNARGTVHFAAKQYLNALEDYTRALNIDGSYTDAYFNRATTHMKLGMYELAAKDYDAVLRIDPSDRNALKKRQEAYKKLGK